MTVKGTLLVRRIVLHLESSRLVLAPALSSEVECNSVRLLFGGHQVDIVGDEELTDASDSPAPRGDKASWSKVRRPFSLFQLFFQSFVLACTDLRNNFRNLKNWGQFKSERSNEPEALFSCSPFQRLLHTRTQAHQALLLAFKELMYDGAMCNCASTIYENYTFLQRF